MLYEPERNCANLRTKGMYVPPNPLADGNTEQGSSTAVYWCLKTMKMTGPDDGFVARDVCIAGRTCFKPQE
jgi:hypothetical protein